MKLAYVLAGAAALALTAGAASAQTFANPGSTSTGDINSTSAGSALRINQMTGSRSVGDAGDAGAQFNLSASVAEDCSFYTGNNSGEADVDFGQLGIFNTSTQGIGNAFRMTGQATAEVETTVAGCNTANRVEIEKANGRRGLRNFSPRGFNTQQFQAEIPYSVTATYFADEPNARVIAGPRVLEVGVTEARDALRNGAWKSGMRLNFVVPVASLALVAGEYTDEVTVTLSAL